MLKAAQGGKVWAPPTAHELDAEKKARSLYKKRHIGMKVSLTFIILGLFVLIIAGLWIGVSALSDEPWPTGAVIMAMTGPIFSIIGLGIAARFVFNE